VLNQASVALGKEGLLVEIKGQPFPAISSNWTIANNAQRSLKGIAELLGFAPTARARLAAPAQQAFEPAADEHGTPRRSLDDWLEAGKHLNEKWAAKKAH
jgi:phage terminase small subunit